MHVVIDTAQQKDENDFTQRGANYRKIAISLKMPESWPDREIHWLIKAQLGASDHFLRRALQMDSPPGKPGRLTRENQRICWLAA